MIWIHFVDNNGGHWLFPTTQIQFLSASVADGSQPVQVFVAGINRPFLVPLAEVESLLGTIPTAISVELTNLWESHRSYITT